MIKLIAPEDIFNGIKSTGEEIMRPPLMKKIVSPVCEKFAPVCELCMCPKYEDLYSPYTS